MRILFFLFLCACNIPQPPQPKIDYRTQQDSEMQQFNDSLDRALQTEMNLKKNF